jgi:hypothetical protein
MRIFIDTDVLLDVLLKREPFFPASAKILDWAETHAGCAAVSWHGLANLHYISKNGAESFIRELLGFAVIPGTGTSQMLQALELSFADLEDAMQVSSALLFGAQFLITRNVGDFKTSPIRAVPPEDVLKLL